MPAGLEEPHAPAALRVGQIDTMYQIGSTPIYGSAAERRVSHSRLYDAIHV